MKRHYILLCFLSGFLMAFTNLCAGTYYVAPDGNDSFSGTEEQPWRTIQKAADVLVAGDTVLIVEGIYTETGPGNRGIEPQNSGTADNPIVYKAYPGNEVIVNPQYVAGGFYIAERSYIVIDSLKIRRALNYGVGCFDASHHITIKSVVACSTRGSDNVTGIGLTNSRDCTMTGCTLFNNWIPGGHQNSFGIVIFGGSDNRVEDCTIYDQAVGFRYKHPGSGSFSLVNNRIHDCTRKGICLATDSCWVYRNLVYDCLNGIRIGHDHRSYRNRIENNTFASCEGLGIWICSNGSYATLRNNIIADCGDSELSVSEEGNVGFNSDYNCFHDFTRNRVVEWLGTDYTLMQFFTATGQDSNSIQLDPTFIKPDGGDFRLETGSPCIGAGEGGVDMGMYPYGSKATRADIDRILRRHKEGEMSSDQVRDLLKKYYREE